MKNNKIINMIATVFVASAFFAMAVGSGTSTDTASKVGEVSGSSKSDSSAEANTKTQYVAGDVIETKSLRISYLSCGVYSGYDQFTAPKDGNKIIYCEFEFENISNSDKFVSSFDFNCFADDNSCDEYIWANDNLSATISAGRKAKGKVYYEVPANAGNVEIEFDSSLLSSNKIIFLYK